jgi:hypothetical protein
MKAQSQLDPEVSRENRAPIGAPALGVGFLAALLALLVLAVPGASAAETLYWDNYGLAVPSSISSANIDGGGGGAFNTGGAAVAEPEGMAIDSPTGRLFWINSAGGSEDNGGVFFANLDGSGGGNQLNTAGAEVNEPLGVTVDSATRTIYWTNGLGGPTGEGSISYANLDGGGGGQLNTSGATVIEPQAIAIDAAAGKLYWSNEDGTIAYASLGGGAGGQLNLSGASAPKNISGLAVDPAAARVYWLDNGLGGERISYASTAGGNGADVNLSGASFVGPFGLALDPAAGRLYWGNYGTGETRLGAIGSAAVGGGGANINIATAPVSGPQDPIVLKSPSAAGTGPQITRGASAPLALACSQGGWGADYLGSFVYQAPRTYAYQWTLNGTAIAGATATTYTAAAPGAYGCTVTGANAAGAATQTATTALTVTAGKGALALKRHKVSTKAGHPATFKITLTNAGELPIAKPTVCVKAPKKARKAVKVPKCLKSGALAGGAKRVVKLKVKTTKAAVGTYKLNFSVGGTSKPLKAKLAIKPAKKKGPKKNAK